MGIYIYLLAVMVISDFGNRTFRLRINKKKKDISQKSKQKVMAFISVFSSLLFLVCVFALWNNWDRGIEENFPLLFTSLSFVALFVGSISHTQKRD